MAEPKIERVVQASRGQYLLRFDDVEEPADLTYSRASPELVIADHTYVPNAMRGRGVGGKLVQAFLDDAKKDGFKVMPLCPFVRAHSQKHPDVWVDVLSS